MVGLVKIFRTEKHKAGTRVYFLCGRLAMEKIQKCWQELSAAVQLLAENPQAQVTLYYKSKNRLNYILTQGSDVPGSCRERISILNKKLGGKGGGKDNMAQGSSVL